MQAESKMKICNKKIKLILVSGGKKLFLSVSVLVVTLPNCFLDFSSWNRQLQSYRDKMRFCYGGTR